MIEQKQNAKHYIEMILVTFGLFVSVLYYSYIFKLGYLKIATYALFFIIIILAFINIFGKRKARKFWIMILSVFAYALLDKYFKIHIILSRCFIKIAIDQMVAVAQTFLPELKQLETFLFVVDFKKEVVGSYADPHKARR